MTTHPSDFTGCYCCCHSRISLTSMWASMVNTVACVCAAQIWDFPTCKSEVTMTGHGGDVKGCDWHPTKAVIASGSKDGLVKVWDAKAGRNIATLHGHRNTVMQTLWNANGNWLLSACRDQSLKACCSTDKLTIHHTGVRVSSSYKQPGSELLCAFQCVKSQHPKDNRCNLRTPCVNPFHHPTFSPTHTHSLLAVHWRLTLTCLVICSKAAVQFFKVQTHFSPMVLLTLIHT